MTDESLPGLHDMLANLPKARVPFQQATEATYGRLYDAYDKFKALHAEAEAEVERLRKEAVDLREAITLVGQSLSLVGERAEQAETERDQALIDLETAKGWRDHAIAERNEYRRANTQLQELATLRASERDRFRRALELIGTDCENYTGSATCVEDGGRRPDAEYTADRWCDGCIARTALDQSKETT